jgi:hypothetical protein
LEPIVNYSRLAECLRTCDEQHDYSESSFIAYQALRDFRLIDVERQCIVMAIKPARYAALSYTWGTKDQFCLNRQNRQALEEQGSIRQAQKLLAQVVNDSMEVCSRMNIPYLWVDSLCIVQDDEIGKYHQIRNMNHIYANAYITLVAAAEKQDDLSSIPSPVLTGLSRVSVPVTPTETTFTIDGTVYVICPGDIPKSLDRTLANTSWFSRGWYVSCPWRLF